MLLTFPVGAVLTTVAGLMAAPATADGGTVYATTPIWADIVDQLDCTDHFAVASLVPAGADPHSYEPSLQDRDAVMGAAAVVANGGGLDANLGGLLDAATSQGAPILTITDVVTTRSADTDDHDHDTEDHDTDHDHDETDQSDHEHEHGDVDPHVWLDPTVVIEALPSISALLVDAGADADDLADCESQLTDDLTALDAEIADLVSEIPESERLLVTNHDALGYFADRYGFQVVGSVLPSTSTLAEASTAALDELGARITELDVPAIFTEAFAAGGEAQALGDRLGVEVVGLNLDVLGEPGGGADTYQSLIRSDATSIVNALTHR